MHEPEAREAPELEAPLHMPLASSTSWPMVVLHTRLGGWQPGLWGQIGRIGLATALMGAAVTGLDHILPALGHLRVVLLVAAGGLCFGTVAMMLSVRALQPTLLKLQHRLGVNRRKP